MVTTKAKIQVWLVLEDASAATLEDMSLYAGSDKFNREFLGERRFEISHFSSSFSLNSIPRARVNLAAGRDAADGTTKAPIHEYASLFRRMTRAKVLFKAEGEYAPGINWPDKEVVIFEGYVASPGLEIASENINYTVDLIHWLTDLDNSSMFGRDSHVANGIGYTFAGFSSGRVPDSGASVDPPSGSFEKLIDFDKVTVVNIQHDLWGSAIKPAFSSLARRTLFKVLPDLITCFGPLDSQNKQAIAALRRMEGATLALVPEEDDLDRSPYTPPLSLYFPDVTPSHANLVAESIRLAMAGDSLEAMFQSTFWGKLVGQYAPTFAFGVVPQVSRALVIPFTIGLRQTYCKKIKNDDYYHINKSDTRFRPVRGVGVWSVQRSMNGLSVPYKEFAGCYQPEDALISDGMIRVVTAPNWLNYVPITASGIKNSSGEADAPEVNTATTPVEPSTPDSESESADDPNVAVEELGDYYERYARWVYISEALRGRNAQLAGKLRFDIAPGSNVALETVTEKHLKAATMAEEFVRGVEGTFETTSFVGTVVSVNITIDCANDIASTGFTLTGVRTQEENAKDATSTDDHPLYAEPFVGAPLIPELAFFEEEPGCGES